MRPPSGLVTFFSLTSFHTDSFASDNRQNEFVNPTLRFRSTPDDSETDTLISEGNQLFRKASQQDAHFVPSLWSVAYTHRVFDAAIGRARNHALGINNCMEDMTTGLTVSSRQQTGRRSLHIQKHTCASCGFPAAKTRKCT